MFLRGREKFLFSLSMCILQVELRKISLAPVSLNKAVFHFGSLVGQKMYSRELCTKQDTFSKLSYASSCLTLKCYICSVLSHFEILRLFRHILNKASTSLSPFRVFHFNLVCCFSQKAPS